MENYHAAEAFAAIEALGHPHRHGGVLSLLAQEQGCSVAEVKQHILGMVLVTSISEQGAWLTSCWSDLGRSSGGGAPTPAGTAPVPAARLLQLAVKAADLGNCAKPVDIGREWSMRVMREFHRQGDEEVRLGVTVSRFMRRRDCITDVPACQAGFARHIALPLFKAMAVAWPSTGRECLLRVEQSVALWEATAAQAAAGAQAQNAKAGVLKKD
jgi:3',5'-cyclic-nucleotide phosphodiesterase